MRLHEFKVEGCGRFPLDMLRYDAAWPMRGEDVARIESPPEKLKRYSVALLTAVNCTPTTARWNSFGWRVTEVNGRPVHQ